MKNVTENDTFETSEDDGEAPRRFAASAGRRSSATLCRAGPSAKTTRVATPTILAHEPCGQHAEQAAEEADTKPIDYCRRRSDFNPGRTRTAVSTPGRYRLRTFAQFGKLAHEESGKRGLPNRFIFTPRNRFSAHRPCGNETAQRPAACAAPHLARALRQRSSRSPPPHIPRKHACPPKPAGTRTHSIEAGPTAVRRRPASAATRGSWTCCAST